MGRLTSGIVGYMLKISGWLFVAVFSKARELDLEDLVVREDFSLFAFASRSRSLAAFLPDRLRRLGACLRNVKIFRRNR